MHVYIRGNISKPRKVGARGALPAREVYDGRESSARYFTVTGKRIGSATQLAEGPQAQAPLDSFIAKWFPGRRPESNSCAESERSENDCDSDLCDDNILKMMFGAKDGAKWRELFDGDHSAYPSQSEADLALCGKLRFYTRGNAKDMDRLFRRSGLMRGKWDEQRGAGTYGERTIATTIEKGGPYYSPRNDNDDAAKRIAKERTAWGKFPLWWAVRLQGAGELAVRVLCVLMAYANQDGEAWPSIETLAAHCRVTKRRIYTAMKPLKAAGVVKVTPRPRNSNLYHLALTVPETITPYAAMRVAPRVMESGHLGCRLHGTVRDHEQTSIDTGEGLQKKKNMSCAIENDAQSFVPGLLDL
ncbi:MAG: helix-turn-helix domain-containing protein [Candidatus Tumulicola sp.]